MLPVVSRVDCDSSHTLQAGSQTCLTSEAACDWLYTGQVLLQSWTGLHSINTCQAARVPMMP